MGPRQASRDREAQAGASRVAVPCLLQTHGRMLSRVLIGGRLAVLDRALGALAGAASALLVVWLLGAVVPQIVGPGPLEPIAAVVAPLGGHSSVVDAVGRALPSTTSDVRSVLTTVPIP